MNPSDNDGDERDEARTIGRKRPYEPSDEPTASEAEDASRQNETNETEESSSSRWGGSLSESDAATMLNKSQEQLSKLVQGSETQVAASALAARAPAAEAPGVGGAMQNPSYLISTSNSEANNNSSANNASVSTADANAFAARAPNNIQQLQAPTAVVTPAFNPLGLNQAALGLDQASLMANLANPANAASLANLMAGGASPELTNLYQLNLIQLMNAQTTAQAQQGAVNPAIALMNAQAAVQAQQGAANQAIAPLLAQAAAMQAQPAIAPLLAQQQAALTNTFLAGNPYNRLLYQQALACTMGTDAQRLQLAAAGLLPGAVSAASRDVSYRPPVKATEGPVLYMPADEDILADNQILLRKQIELFAADEDDVNAVTPGRRKEITLGQVGIRCKYCTHIPIHHRSKGAVYYPSKLKGIYQASQNMATSHFCEACDNIDPLLKAELRAYQQGKSTAGHGGKQYWADSAKLLGVIETEENGLRFDPARKLPNKTDKEG